jgi:hypothetical protein
MAHPGRVAQAFDLAGIQPPEGCPVLRAFCEGPEPRTASESGLCGRDKKKGDAASIATRPCNERKDEAPAREPASDGTEWNRDVVARMTWTLWRFPRETFE